MIITESKPRTRQFYLRQERSDSDYGTCLWAAITFDLDRYSMTAESDCGNYAYCWTPTPQSESFLRLMCRVDQDYLLRKISAQSVFNLEESKKMTLSALDDSEVTGELREEIMDIEVYGDEMFYRECGDVLNRHGVHYDFETIECAKEYPRGAVKFAEIFCQSLQPYLRELVKREEAAHE